ncbi:hypothetical protein C5S32_04930 [ANME-1 cluster archaeon GoMg1]|nr:hypothetical protein [ANME-1 cluster archaeon GoMg1]
MPDEKNALPGEELREVLKGTENPLKVWDVIKKAISALSCLEIRTEVIGGAKDEVISTKIDLFQSDRTNQIHRNFLKDPDLAPLRDFHAEQVKLAEQDIQKKLEFLLEMAIALVSAINEAKGEKGTSSS